MRKFFKSIKIALIERYKNRIMAYLKRYEEKKFMSPQSILANNYLTGKRGIEIGGSIHNQFKLNTLNINFTDNETIYSDAEKDMSRDIMKVDIVANGNNLPFKDEVWDFVISSHVLEHFFDPIQAIEEWLRVIKHDGYVFMIVPHKERTFDKDRDRTPLQELLDRHSGKIPEPMIDSHHSVWITEDVLELCKHMNWNVVDFQDIDDKVGNGFTIVIQKEG